MIGRAQRTARDLSAAIALLGTAAAGCAEAPGELMLVIQTDMSLPEDIDTIRVEIFSDGIPKFKWDYERLGTNSSSLFLPATIGLIANEDDPSASTTIQVSGRSGIEARVVREVVTQIPEDRVATLHIPLHYLCVGSAEPALQDDNVLNACPDGQTCKGGVCQSNELTPAEVEALDDYSAAEVFGGGTGNGDGTCFDVALCLASPTDAALDMETCTIADPGGELNVAIVTENAGMCNGRGCFIALDADSDTGWRRRPDGRIQLPPGVCTPEDAFDTTAFIGGVVTAPVGSGCPHKEIRIPTCGPWSSVGSASTPSQEPTAVISGQTRLGALRIAGDAVLWASGGVQTNSGFPRSAVKRASLAGGPVQALYAEGLTSPRSLAVAGNHLYWTAAGAVPNGGALMRAPLDGAAGEELLAAENMEKPEGLAIANDRLFWTDFEQGEIRRLDLPADGSAPAGPSAIVAPNQNRPYRVVANEDAACWTNEGTLMQADGSIGCWLEAGGTLEEIAPQQGTPRAIALGQDALYWANFVGGEIMKAVWNGTTFVLEGPIATGQSNPNGLAVDGEDVYWTNRGDGVVQVKRGANAPVVLATAQDRPGEIVVTEAEIFWINEGELETAGGRIMQLAKPQP